MNFEKLNDFFKRVPAVGEKNIIAHGHHEQQWWYKFQIDIEHPLAWQTVQELGHVLNYISTNERLPTVFKPVSPPPYMNGPAKQFLAWVIEGDHIDFPPDVICEWLEGRLPNPVDDESQWHIMTELKEYEQAIKQDQS
ncbi:MULTISPECIES: hypothetical protein [unclassified Acinetobacter]|uniref:hypothetical protein n=1 Tax=unclassified Acinetobacter TaxID=196816 RepID=UPI0035BB5298